MEYIGEISIFNEPKICHMVRLDGSEKKVIAQMQVTPIGDSENENCMIILCICMYKDLLSWKCQSTNQIDVEPSGYIEMGALFEWFEKEQRHKTQISVLGYGFRENKKLSMITDSLLFLQIGSKLLQLGIPNAVWDAYSRQFKEIFLYFEWKDSIFEFDTNLCSVYVLDEPENISKIQYLRDDYCSLRLNDYRILFCPNYYTGKTLSGLRVPRH